MDQLSPQIKGAITRKINNAVAQYKQQLQQERDKNKSLQGSNLYLHRRIKTLQKQIIPKTNNNNKNQQLQILQDEKLELEAKLTSYILPTNLIDELTNNLNQKCELLIDQKKYKYVNYRMGIG